MRPCPRCDYGETVVVGRSPVPGKWELYLCKRCEFVWRSTETEAQLAQTVKLTKSDIENALDIRSLK